MSIQDQIQWTVDFTIMEGKHDEFLELIEQLTKTVERKESGTKSYRDGILIKRSPNAL